MTNLALDYTRRLEAARQRRFAQQRARQHKLDALPDFGRIDATNVMPAIRMHITPWVKDEFGNRVRWAFQEGDNVMNGAAE